MSMNQEDVYARLQWTVGDRLEKALSVAGVTSLEMAEYLGLSRNTISNYLNDRTPVGKQTLRLWALKTGVPLEWLETGIAPQPHGPEGDDGSRLWESNPRPIHYKGNTSAIVHLFPALREAA